MNIDITIPWRFIFGFVAGAAVALLAFVAYIYHAFREL